MSRALASRAVPLVALLLQAGSVLVSAGTQRLPAPAWPVAAAAVALVAVAAVGWSWPAAPHRRRPALALLIAAQLALVALFWAARPERASDTTWVEARRRDLSARAVALEPIVERLGLALDGVAAAAGRTPGADAFDLVETLASEWTRDRQTAAVWPLAVVLWRDGERLAWSSRAQPLPPPGPDAVNAEGRGGRVAAGRDGWYWRRYHRLPGAAGGPAVLELQLWLAPQEGAAGAGQVTLAGAASPASRVEPGAVAEPLRLEGDARAGLMATLARPLPDPGDDGFARRLRLVLAEPARGMAAHAPAARRLVALLAVWAVALAAWGAAVAGASGALAGAWAARLLCARVDLLRWAQPASGREISTVSPEGLSSLIDPAYFATPALGGLLASVADALATALLLAATAALLWRRTSARTAPASPAGRARRADFATAALWGLAAVAVLLATRWLALTLAESANPRLIGPRIPYRHLSFWALHLSLLAACASLVGLLHRGATRLGRGWGVALSVAVAVVAGGAAARGLDGVARVALLLASLLLCGGGALARKATPTARRLALLAPALVTVTWIYGSLAEAYRRAETAWLERKAAEIVAPQQEWLSFLLGDALAGMAAADAQSEGQIAAVSVASAELWRNWPAFDLWRRSTVRDLGLPCLVELIDGEGRGESFFASGFFRDFGYEVGERQPWVSLEPRGEQTPAGAEIRAQAERRRFPAGDEWILRGEIARANGSGWIRLELPMQSRRIATLLAGLEGAAAAGPGPAYQPRAEVDRGVLLVRGGARGWLDAGSGPFPDVAAERVIAARGAPGAPWTTVRAGETSYRCVWQPVPAARATEAGEGFLLGVEEPGFGDRLLDLSRLSLLHLLLAAVLVVPVLLGRLARRGRPLALGFQERFFAAYLVLGMLPLLLAGTFIDRLTVQGLAAAARAQARDGLEAALAQLQGLLGEQARALAGSEYIADLLASRMEGLRPVGPFEARQAILFDGDGRLLLDETLSDLDEVEAARLLDTARAAPLVVMEADRQLYLGLIVPVDLSDLMLSPAEARADEAAARDRQANGWFFYRQLVGDALLAGLAEIVQGEVALSEDGEIVLASHPERVFAGAQPPLMAPSTARRLSRWPGSPDVATAPGTRLSFTASLALPALALDEDGGLRRRTVPAALSIAFPARERELSQQRERTVLSLAGLATLIFLTAAALGLALAWRIFGPVRVLVNATRRLAGGDFAAPLPETGRDEVGLLSASFQAMRDDLARAQGELASRERFLATVLARVPVGVVVFRADGSVTVLNPAAADILAAASGEAAEPPEAAAVALREAFRARIADLAEGEAELRRGHRTLRGRLAPLRAEAGEGELLLVFEDVTEFLDTKRLALNAELARQVAHEIKNPLTPIQLSIQFLEQAFRDRAPGLDDVVRDTVRQVLGQVALLRQIATEFSLLGKPGALPVAPLELPRLVRRLTDRYRNAGAAGGPRVDIAPDAVPAVLADAESLEKVLANLMENSLQAVGDPARLELTVTWEVTPREVTLQWADNGGGLPPDVAERLFELYFSTKSQGTGLGLAICRSLLERMGGRIALSNRRDGAGAVAAVTLPRAAPETSSTGG